MSKQPKGDGPRGRDVVRERRAVQAEPAHKAREQANNARAPAAKQVAAAGGKGRAPPAV